MPEETMTANPVYIRPTSVEVRIGKDGEICTITPFTCTCEDQTYRDVCGNAHFCRHIELVLNDPKHLFMIRLGVRSIRVPSNSRSGVFHTVTMLHATCGRTRLESHGFAVCEHVTVAYPEFGWRMLTEDDEGVEIPVAV